MNKINKSFANVNVHTEALEGKIYGTGPLLPVHRAVWYTEISIFIQEPASEHEKFDITMFRALKACVHDNQHLMRLEEHTVLPCLA
jgi:hypothetical protein